MIFLSDNGRAFPGAKTTLYDEGIHLPLIIASPTQSKRRREEPSHGELGRYHADHSSDGPASPGPKGYSLQGRSILPILELSQPRDQIEYTRRTAFMRSSSTMLMCAAHETIQIHHEPRKRRCCFRLRETSPPFSATWRAIRSQAVTGTGRTLARCLSAPTRRRAL